jgi:hypothetical protein
MTLPLGDPARRNVAKNITPHVGDLRPTSRWSDGEMARCFSAVRSDAIDKRGSVPFKIFALQYGRSWPFPTRRLFRADRR